MTAAQSAGGGAPASSIRYQPDERPPEALAFGLGLQMAILQIAGIVLTPAIVIRAAGLGEPYLSWAVFAALTVCGLSTILQANRVGRFGAGHVLLMGTSGAFIAISVAALREGGPALLAVLVLVSSLFQFGLAFRLAWLRRVITPTVAGIVIMLIAATVMPILFPLLGDVPEGAGPLAAPLSAGAALAVFAGLALRARGFLRLWAPIIGVAVGSTVGALTGIFDFGPVVNAGWIGIPTGWPGLDFSFGASFWALLPAFIFVTLIGAIETIGDSIAIQRVSWRKPQAPDYRVVAGAVAADGVGNLLSGVLATVPNTTYSNSISITELTGVASRRVGTWIGASFLGLALLPKVAALFLAIPGPVVGAFGIGLIGILFSLGMHMVVKDGMNLQKAVIVGLSFWVGSGFQGAAIFPELLEGFWGILLDNGMTAGGLMAILLMVFLNLTGARPKRLDTSLDMAAGPKIEEFLTAEASRRGWDGSSTNRLVSAGEEALLTLLDAGETAEAAARQLRLTARTGRRSAELEFVAAAGGLNIEDRLAMMGDRPEVPDESEISLRLLKHYASSVRHQKYHDVDIVTVEVSGRA